MITLFVLMAQMTGGGFAMMPFSSQDGCRAAVAGLQPAIVAEAQCVEIEMIAPGSAYAPVLAPLPKPKPGRRA